MSSPLSASEYLDREFLGIRSRLLDVAATLDRIDRAAGDVSDDARLVKLRQAMALLAGPGPDRAEAFQMLFSLEYDPNWRAAYGANGRG